MTELALDQNTPHVLLAGDTHGNSGALEELFLEANASGALAILQLGDFGYGWSRDDEGNDEFSALAAQYVATYGVPLYWIDGNHENFDELLALPVDPTTGLREVAPGVFHIPRGEVATFGDTTFMGFGGAYSVDKAYRQPGYSWWPQETVTDEDVERALQNAGRAQVFLSHDAPYGVHGVRNLERKLSDWGDEATRMSLENQRRVRTALDASGATRAFHGHLHQSYVQEIDSGVVVRGLNRDDATNNTYALVV